MPQESLEVIKDEITEGYLEYHIPRGHVEFNEFFDSLANYYRCERGHDIPSKMHLYNGNLITATVHTLKSHPKDCGQVDFQMFKKVFAHSLVRIERSGVTSWRGSWALY